MKKNIILLLSFLFLGISQQANGMQVRTTVRAHERFTSVIQELRSQDNADHEELFNRLTPEEWVTHVDRRSGNNFICQLLHIIYKTNGDECKRLKQFFLFAVNKIAIEQPHLTYPNSPLWHPNNHDEDIIHTAALRGMMETVTLLSPLAQYPEALQQYLATPRQKALLIGKVFKPHVIIATNKASEETEQERKLLKHWVIEFYIANNIPIPEDIRQAAPLPPSHAFAQALPALAAAADNGQRLPKSNSSNALSDPTTVAGSPLSTSGNTPWNNNTIAASGEFSKQDLIPQKPQPSPEFTDPTKGYSFWDPQFNNDLVYLDNKFCIWFYDESGKLVSSGPCYQYRYNSNQQRYEYFYVANNHEYPLHVCDKEKDPDITLPNAS